MNASAATPPVRDIELAGHIGPHLLGALRVLTQRQWTGEVSQYGAYLYILREVDTGLCLSVSSQRGSNCASAGSVQVRHPKAWGSPLRININASKTPDAMARDIMRRIYADALAASREIAERAAAQRQHEDGVHALISTLALAMGEQPPSEGVDKVTAYYGDAEKRGGLRVVEARAESPDSVRMELRNLTKSQALAVLKALHTHMVLEA